MNAGDTPLRPIDKLCLSLVSEPFLVPVRLHALAALVLGNFRFASFLERAHLDFQIRESRLNHLIHGVATQFFPCALLLRVTNA
jgi:hypothetical protein